MSGWGALGGYIEDLGNRARDAADPTNTSPETNALRRACDWAARKGGVVSASPQVRLGCGPYWEEQDDYDPPDEPVPGGPPFEGGQCAVLYKLEVRAVPACDGEVLEIKRASGVIGPISLDSEETLSEDTSGGCTTRIYRSRWRLGNGVVITINDRSESRPSYRWVPADDSPDECGDPPSDPPTLPAPRPVPPTVLPPDGQPVDIRDPSDPDDRTPPITFPPTDTPFDPFVPIINPPPGFPPFFFPPSGDAPPVVGEPFDVTGAGEDEDDEDDGITELIGYEFEVLDSRGFQTRIPGTNPVIYTRVVGSLQLRLEDTSGRVFYSDNLQITSQRGSIVRTDRSLKVTGVSYNSIPQLDGLRLRQIRGVAL